MIVRLLQIGDLHLSEYSTIGGRLVVNDFDGMNAALADRIQATMEIIRVAKDKAGAAGLDGIVVTGDVFDRARPTPIEMRAAGELLKFASNECHAKMVLVIAGNHDEPRNTKEPTALASVELAPFLRVMERPEVTEYGGVLIACLPYPRRAAFREVDADMADPKGFYEKTLKAISYSMMAIIAEQRKSTQKPWALAYHGSVGGAQIGVQPRTLEGDIDLCTEAMDIFPAAMLGHIHKQQKVGRNGWYSGSPCIMDFGEAEESHGGILWTFDGDLEPVATPLLVNGRQWKTLILRDADEAKVEEFVARIAALPASGIAYRFQGRGTEAEIRKIRNALRIRIAEGLIVKDEMSVQRENRMRDASMAAEKMTDEVMLRKALATRAIDGDRADRLLLVHAEVMQEGGTR